MKTDFSKLPREEVEARITTMLMGEMAPDEAAELRQFVAGDVELARLAEELKQTISLVGEASAAEEPALSDARREALLQQFKVIPARELTLASGSEHARRSWLALAAMIAFLLVVSGLMLPALSKFKSKSMRVVRLESESLPESKMDELREGANLRARRDLAAKGAASPQFKGDPDWIGVLERPKERLQEEQAPSAPRNTLMNRSEDKSVRRTPVAPDANGLGAVRGRQEANEPALASAANNWKFDRGDQSGARGFGIALPQESPPPAMTPPGQPMPQTAAEPQRFVTRYQYFSDKEAKDINAIGGVAQKIELPNLAVTAAAAAPQAEEAKVQAGQAGGLITFGGGDGGYVGFDTQANLNRSTGGVVGGAAIDRAGVLPEFQAARPAETVVGKDVTLAYSDQFGVGQSQTARGLVGNDVGHVTAEGIADLSDRKKESGTIDTRTGLPSASAAAAISNEAIETDGKISVSGQVSDTSKFGIAGGDSMASMQYYMQNPDLMKRYFPQMYAMMQKQGGGSNFNGAAADMPGSPAPMYSDPYARYRGMPMSQPAAVAGTIPAKPAQQVALGAEVTTLNGQAEGGRDRKLAEPSKKTEASVVRAGKPTEVGAADQLKESEKTFAQQTARVDELRRNSKLPEAKTESEKAARELDQLQSLRASVDQRIAQEKADSAIPKAGSTALFEPATAEGGKRAVLGDVPVLGRLFKNGEERVAKLEVVKGPDVSALMTNQPAVAYDPYFTLSEADLIRSQKVLGNVVDDLKLDQKWGEQEGRKLDRTEALERLKKSVTVQEKGNGILEIHARDEKGAEAAQIANKVAEAYQKERLEQRGRASQAGVEALTKQVAEIDAKIAQKKAEVETLAERGRPNSADVAVKRVAANAAIPQPEISTAENAFSTFSLNVSDVSFKLAAASLEKGLMPEAATVRSEEFINAFDYRDPEPQGAPIGFVWERARYPFAQGRDLLRFSVKTAASGRQAGKPLNLVLLLDSSGSMERADRVRILQECLKTLAAQLRPEDKISVVAFARTARLWIDGLPGSQANELAQRVGNLNPEGGTNLEEAMKVAYETARKHFNAEGVNRVVLLTDGAANLGDVEPESLKRKVESERKKGVALDCFGIGWEGLNDELLETLSRNGDGRYGFVNTPEAAASEFAGQLAGALNVAASDVKVQVEWNPKRVTAFRQIGYAKHQLTKEQFRDNTVDAAEIGAAEAGNALYVVQVNAAGEGPLGTVRVRFKVPGTNDYREHAWPLNYEGASKALENANYTLRLAGTASAFSEWLVSSPYAAEVTPDKLLTILSGVPEHFAPDPRPTKLEWMIRQAKSLAGK